MPLAPQASRVAHPELLAKVSKVRRVNRERQMRLALRMRAKQGLHRLALPALRAREALRVRELSPVRELFRAPVAMARVAARTAAEAVLRAAPCWAPAVISMAT